MPDSPAVRAVNVSKRYGRRAPALVDIDLVIERGAIVTLAGSNGSGKSTLLRCIAGLARFKGEIEVCGHSVPGDGGFRRSVGYLPQSVTLPPHSTVDEALSFFAEMRCGGITEVSLPERFLPARSNPVGTLSGGQRQRLALAIALLGSPEVLLLDEPVSNLDASGRESVWNVMRELKQAGTTILIASPSPVDLAGLGDRMVQLDDGKIVADRKMAAA